MNKQLKHIINRIGDDYKDKIQPGVRHYLEVSIGQQAEKLGFLDLKEEYKNTYAVVPLKSPQKRNESANRWKNLC